MITLSAGFADPVADAQFCFRAVLDAMARPGRIHTVRGVDAPPPLCNAAAAILLTLADHETPLSLDSDAAQQWIAFHTGAPMTALGDAIFAFALSLPDLAALPNGSDEMPETAATVILQVKSFASGRKFVLAGPGLQFDTTVEIDGLPEDFAAIWQRNHALFPRGIDLIVCVGDQLTALPRSVSIKDA